MPKELENGKKRQLFARLTPADYNWWYAQVKRVKQEEDLIQCSLPLLMHRIAKADLDLTQESIAHYRATRPKKKN